MQNHPPIIDYGRGHNSPLPLSVEQTAGGFRIIIQGKQPRAIVATIGWSIVWVVLVICLVTTSEWLGLIFMGIFVACASFALLISIQALREKIVQYADGELLILFQVYLWQRRIASQITNIRDLYAADESIHIRLLDGHELPACALGSVENAHATLQLLRAMLPRRATPDQT